MRYLQFQKKLTGQSKEIKQKWKRPKGFDICFSVMSTCYGQSLISGRDTGHWALPPTNFKISSYFLVLSLKSFENS